MTDNANDDARRNRRLTWLVWRQRIADNLLAAVLLAVIFGVLGAVVAESREAVAQHRAMLTEVQRIERSHGRSAVRVLARLDSGAIVPVRQVPEFCQDARIIVEESVSNIFRLRRYTFVSFEDGRGR